MAQFGQEPTFDVVSQLRRFPSFHRNKNMPNFDDAWPFEDAPNLACFTVKSIMDEAAPILLVFHDEDDGAWQMLPDNGADVSTAMIVGLEQLVRLDETLVELANLPLGWSAWRESETSPWIRQAKSEMPVN